MDEIIELQELERRLARRVGPFFQCVPGVIGRSTTQIAPDVFKSTLDLGELEGLYVLRRGLINNTKIPGFDSSNRIRRVKQYTPDIGEIVVDRAWSDIPNENESIEFHSIHPEILRQAVQDGLKHCYRVEEISVNFPDINTEQNISALVGWITDPSQIYSVKYSYPNSVTEPIAVGWAEAFRKNGDVWLRVRPTPFPSTVILEVRRPVHTYIRMGANWTDTTVGPTDDTHAVLVAPDYAVAAAHVKLWEIAYPQMSALAQAKLGPPQEAVYIAFARESRTHFTPPRPRPSLRQFFHVPKTPRV